MSFLRLRRTHDLQFPVPVPSQSEVGRAHATVLQLVWSTVAFRPTEDAPSVKVPTRFAKTISSNGPHYDIQQVANWRLGAVDLGSALQISISLRQPARAGVARITGDASTDARLRRLPR